MKSTVPYWGAACAAAAAARRDRCGQDRVQRGLRAVLSLTSTAQKCHGACEFEEPGGGVVPRDAGRDEAPGGCGRHQNRPPAARWRALARVLGCSARGGARRGRVPRPRARCGQSLHEEDIEGFEGLDEDVKPRVRELIEEHKVEHERRFEKAPRRSKKKAPSKKAPSKKKAPAQRRSRKKVRKRLEPTVNESEKRALMHNVWQGARGIVTKFQTLIHAAPTARGGSVTPDPREQRAQRTRAVLSLKPATGMPQDACEPSIFAC
mmetsp:Transcript_23227/g.71449  ORF Transcript_23227/g.71449 Transcript_23227/m.71449 type:complete len:264 (+) Transcript_23227:246-1037(+)